MPDRSQLTMTVPFMRAYTELLVRSCHKRGAHAIGGMSAFIPSRKDEEVNKNAFAAVRADKQREANDGFDGTWVAHPALVPIAKQIFDAKLGSKPHQKHNLREDVKVTAADLLNFTVPNGARTEAGLRNCISVAIQYIESYLRGVGAAAINNLMEDAATAEISRSIVWLWVRNGSTLQNGRRVTLALVRELQTDELAKLKQAWGDATYRNSRVEAASAIFTQLVSNPQYVEFLTTPAYQELISRSRRRAAAPAKAKL